MKREKLEGRAFGSWKVIEFEGCFDGKKSFYKCMCTKCGSMHSVRADKMKAGRSTQCMECSRLQRKCK